LVQGEGRPTISLMQVKQDATSEERSVAATMQGAYHAANGHACLASLEEADEPLIDAAITQLVEETLADFSAWEDEPWKSTQQ
jgi:DNA-binding IclR family transcriptional regulator